VSYATDGVAKVNEFLACCQNFLASCILVEGFLAGREAVAQDIYATNP